MSEQEKKLAENLGRRTRKAREIHGLSIADAAQSLGLSEAALIDRESGAVNWSTLEITRLCRLLVINISDLFSSPLYAAAKDKL